MLWQAVAVTHPGTLWSKSEQFRCEDHLSNTTAGLDNIHDTHSPIFLLVTFQVEGVLSLPASVCLSACLSLCPPVGFISSAR